MKIDEYSDGNIEEFHAAQKLRLVDRQDFLRRFCFHKHATLHEQIEAERLFPRKAFVFDRHEFLADTLQPAQSQFLE